MRTGVAKDTREAIIFFVVTTMFLVSIAIVIRVIKLDNQIDLLNNRVKVLEALPEHCKIGS